MLKGQNPEVGWGGGVGVGGTSPVSMLQSRGSVSVCFSAYVLNVYVNQMIPAMNHTRTKREVTP